MCTYIHIPSLQACGIDGASVNCITGDKLFPVSMLNCNEKLMSDGNIYSIKTDELVLRLDNLYYGKIIRYLPGILLFTYTDYYMYLYCGHYYCIGKINEISEPLIISYDDYSIVYIYKGELYYHEPRNDVNNIGHYRLRGASCAKVNYILNVCPLFSYYTIYCIVDNKFINYNFSKHNYTIIKCDEYQSNTNVILI